MIFSGKKGIIKRIASVICLAMCLTHISAPSVYAAAARPERMLHQIPYGMTQISSFSIPYPGNSSSATNVSLGVLHIDGSYIEPGAEFSFSECLGSRIAENGYKAGAAFNGSGGTIMSYGGGICRVATGLYNALIRAGIVPTERMNHSGRVNYPGVALGLDAAIASGCKDLKFTNNFKYPVYIEAYSGNDEETGKYSFTINVYSDESVTNGNSYSPYAFQIDGNSYDAYLLILHDGEEVGNMYLGRSVYH